MIGKVNRTSCFTDLSFLPQIKRDFTSFALPRDDTAQVLRNRGRPLAWVSPILCWVPKLQHASLLNCILHWVQTRIHIHTLAATSVPKKPAELLTGCCKTHCTLHINSNNCIWYGSFIGSSIGWTVSNVISTLAKHLIWTGTELVGTWKPTVSRGSSPCSLSSSSSIMSEFNNQK